MTRGQTTIRFGENINAALLTPFTSEHAALRYLEGVAAENEHNRVMIDAYDCSKTRGQRWTRVFANDGRVSGVPNPHHHPGISVARLLELAGQAGGLERVLIDFAGTGKYPVRGSPINHVCIYNIYVFYRGELKKQTQRKARVKELAQQGKLL